MSSKEIEPYSGNEYLTELVTTVSKRILDGADQIRKDMEAAALDSKISKHYYGIAEETMHDLWRLCAKKTRRKTHWRKTRTHKQITDQTGGKICSLCSKPMGDTPDVLAREIRGITKLAAEMRNHDKAAGVEWKP